MKKSAFNRVKNYILSKLFFNSKYGLYRFLSDREFLEKKYRFKFGEKLDLNDPTGFNEKIQWLKLYDRNDLYSTMVDKCLVKEYVSGIIGEEYIIPILKVWSDPKDVDFSELPNQFVLKCNHNSGTGMYICKDKSNISENEKKQIIRGLKHGIKENYYLIHREWPYKNVKKCVLAEEYIETSDGDLPDYKFHCFNGAVKFILVCKNRFSPSGMTEDFFTREWEHIDVKRPLNRNSEEPIKKPEKLEQMISLAEKIAANIPFLRVDFYITQGKIFFGETTFYPASGFENFVPNEWDETFGSYLQLPDKKTDQS